MTIPHIENLEALSVSEILDQLPSKVDEILDTECNVAKKLMKVCMLLEQSIPYYDWVGFYLPDPNSHRELILGPYIGEETDHDRIPYGIGICGQVAESNETFVSDDVQKESNYLSCSVNVRSEIVVPVKKNGAFVGQLDIDSHTVAAITEKDRAILEEICEKLSILF